MEISNVNGPPKLNSSGLYNPNFSGSFETNRNEFERQSSLGSGESGNFTQNEYDQSNQSNFFIY